MKRPVFTGSSVAIVTPFTADNKINYDVFGKMIDFQIENGTDAITVCGTTGESACMNDQEHRECIEFCVEKVAGRVPVIAGTGSNDTAYAVELSKHAQSVGVDAILMVTPYYNKATQKGLIRHYLTVADAVDVPIILYHVPSRTGCSFTPATYQELSKHPNINGVKEASGNFSMLLQTMALCGDELNVWSGNDDQVVAMLALGAKGVISVVSNILPAVMHQMCSAFFEGDIAKAAAMQKQYCAFTNALFCEVNPIPVKTAMNLLGWNVGQLRLPLCEMEDKTLAQLKKAMLDIGLSVQE